MADVPFIRDVLHINDTVQKYYNEFTGAGPLFLLGREVVHDSGYVLQLNGRPLVIIADSYDGAGGGIDGSGGIYTGNGTFKQQPTPVAGGNGTNGANAVLHKVGTQWRPVSAGGNGTPGGGGTSGSPGTSVTLLCRSGNRIRINVAATPSAPGGDGGSGGMGGDGLPDRVDPSTGETIEGFPGTHGGRGGNGGNGGNGANGGTLVLLSTSALPQPSLTYGSTPGSHGGRGGRYGHEGVNAPENDDDDPRPTFAANGTNGVDGSSPAPEITVLDNLSYRDRLLSVLGTEPKWNLPQFWAPFRVSVGERFFRQFQPDNDADTNGVMAAWEYQAALEMQGDNAEAARLQTLLQSGVNAIGLPRYMDVVPDFNRYSSTYTSAAGLVTQFFNAGVGEILAAEQLDAIKSLLTEQTMTAQGAVNSASDDLAAAHLEQKNSSDEVVYIQQELDDATAQIHQAMAAMQSHSITIGGVIGTVAEIGGAVASVIAAIPTGGASLVALVPAVIALTSTVVKDGSDIVQSVFAGEKADTDAVEKAYQKVGKDVAAVIAAGKTIVNFVNVVKKITSATTPENAQTVALVKRGAELTHQLLVAKNDVELSTMRLQSTQKRLSDAQGLLNYALNASNISLDAIRTAGETAMRAALSHADELLTFAFLAQRSFEIYTLPATPPQAPVLLAGTCDPDKLRAYQDGMPNSAQAVVDSFHAAWDTLLQPIELQQAYVNYLQRSNQSDLARLEFNADNDSALLEQFRTTRVLPFQFDVSTISQGRRETKIRGVAVSLVGASSPSSLISCEVWHGGLYEQIGPDGTLVPQQLEAKSYTLPAPVTPLMLDGVHFGQDDPIDAPQALPLWGRGVGGEWNLRLPATQPGGEAVDLSGLHTVQVWIGYQFVPEN